MASMRSCALLAVLLLLGGCTATTWVDSDVTRFHALPMSPSGQTFVVLPLDAEQQDSLAFKQYAALIDEDLSGMGLRRFEGGEPGKADYVVTLSYSVQGPETEVRIEGGSRVSFGAGFGHWGHPWGWGTSWTYGYPGYHDPFYDPYYARSRQVYVRRVELDIYSGASWATPQRERVFEARALSQGSNADINPVMPFMLHAIFDEFPGVSGQTRSIRVQTPEGTVVRRSARDAKSDVRWRN